MRRALLVAVAAACGRDAAAPVPPWMPPPVAESERSFGAPDPAFDAYLAALRDLAARGDRDGLLARLPASLGLREWFVALNPDRALTIERVTTARIGALTRAKLVLHARGGHAGPRSIRIDLFFEDGRRPELDNPTAAERQTGALAAVRGDVVLDPATRWIRADLSLALVEAPFAPFVLSLPSTGLRVDVGAGGRALRFLAYNDVAVIEPFGTDYDVRFEGRLDDSVVLDPSEDVRYLRLLPLVGLIDGTPTRVELTVHHPADTEVFASLPAGPADHRYDGWRALRLAGTTDTLVVWAATGDGPQASADVALGDATATLTAPEDRLDLARAALRTSWDALSVLGPLPERALRVHVMPALAKSDHATGTIGLGFLPGEDQVWLTAHELAHAWFGGGVIGVGSTATRWWEAVANYVSLWPLSAEHARARRQMWAWEVLQLAPERERPDLSDVAVDDAADVLSYERGALVLCALEARVGRPAMVRWLRALFAAHHGKRTDLEAVLATIGPALGAEHEAWVRRWFTADRPATADLTGMRIVRDRLHATLVVDAPVPELRLVARFFSHGALVGDPVTLAIAGPRTAIDLPVSEVADTIDLGFDVWAPIRGVNRPWTYGLAFRLPGRPDDREDLP